jgi:hypothetical protein
VPSWAPPTPRPPKAAIGTDIWSPGVPAAGAGHVALLGYLCGLCDTFDILHKRSTVDPRDSEQGASQVLHKFQAEIRHSPPVTMLHTLTCPALRSGSQCMPGDIRVVRAKNVADAVLGLIEAYMCDGVRRQVSVCNCARSGTAGGR